VSPHVDNGALPTLEYACAYLRGGLSVIPIALDGSKVPTIKWKRFETSRPTEVEANSWFRHHEPPGIAVITGKISGNLEAIDFDKRAAEIYPKWSQLVMEEAPGLLSRLTIHKTPRPGCHVIYRCPGALIPGNTKLAQMPGTDPKTNKPTRFSLIESSGENGYIIVPGSPVDVHETKRPYEHHSGPPLANASEITPQEREILWRCALALNECVEEAAPKKGAKGKASADRPGDDFNARGPDWSQILDGWELVHQKGAVRYWRRPGKEGKGWSATTGHCTSTATGHELFAVFSQNADPFPGPNGSRQCSTHSKFGAYALIHHGGDHEKAARALAAEGYGKQKEQARGGADEQGADPIHLSDMGNAVRVVAKFGPALRYCYLWKKWLAWDQRHWSEDDTGRVERAAKNTVRNIYLEAGQCNDEKQRAALAKHAFKSEARDRVAAMIALAQSEPGIAILPDEMDKDPWLLNVANGTLDLQSGKLREFRRQDLITKLCPTPFDEDACCRLWLQTLQEIFQDDKEIIAYFKRLCGYALTGSTREQILPIFWGKGANGKTTIINAIMEVLGEDYAIKASRDLFMAKKADSHPAQIARLFGKRLVVVVESHQGARLDEGLVKELTGSDPLTARRMREDWWQFWPTHKCALVTNHRPHIRGSDDGIWRRPRLIPFTRQFKDDQDDKTLPDKLKAEYPGILAWMLAGCLDWLRHGIQTPAGVINATKIYREEEDLIGNFIAQRCIIGPGNEEESTALYQAFKHYCEANGEHCPSQMVFGNSLTERGFEKGRSPANDRIIRKGIKLDPIPH
jgi:putative DNA primase/helicase